MDQETIWAESEGGLFAQRNYSGKDAPDEARLRQLENMLQRLPFTPARMLEIGCSLGVNLEFYRTRIGAECHGVDISNSAVEEGKKRFPKLDLRCGSASQLPFEDLWFDFVSFDICLYTMDPQLLHKVASEADRVLRNGGLMVLYDFNPPYSYRNTNHHDPRMFSYKFPVRDMFLWHPAYSLIELQSMSLDTDKFVKGVDDRVAYSVLYKADLNDPSVFLTDPFGTYEQKRDVE